MRVPRRGPEFGCNVHDFCRVTQPGKKLEIMPVATNGHEVWLYGALYGRFVIEVAAPEFRPAYLPLKEDV